MPVNRRSGLIVCFGALLLGCGANGGADSAELLTAPQIPDQSGVFVRQAEVALGRLEQGSGLPALPKDSALSAEAIRARRGSVIGQTPLRGDDVYDAPGQLWDKDNPNIDLDRLKHQLTLTPESGGLSWGLYKFENLLPEDNPNQVTVDVSGLLPPRYYVAVADYGAQRWRWQSVESSSGMDVLPLAGVDEDPIQPLSADGSLYLVIASYDGVEITIDRLLLGLDSPAPPPGGLEVVQVEGIAMFMLSWLEPTFAYEAIRVERTGDLENNNIFHLDVPAGQSMLIDQPRYANGVPLVGSGRQIHYRLRAVVAGRAGPPGPWVSCWRVPEPLANLTAGSDLPFEVALDWDWGGNSHVEVYRDSPDQLIAVTDGPLPFLDGTVEDYEDHDYWIRGYLDMDDVTPGLKYYTNMLGPVSGTRLKAPYITWVQPTPAQSGQSVSFTPVVYGQPPLSYSWDFDGATTPDTSTELEPTVTAGAAGFTRCTFGASNAHGSDSHEFDLLITDGPRPWMQFKYDQGNSGRVPFPGATVGEELWQFPSGATIYGPVVFGLDGTIYFGNEAGNFHALNPDGSEKWMLPLGEDIECSALVGANGDIYVASDKLYCIDPAGTVSWEQPAASGGYHLPPNLRPDGNLLCNGAVVSPQGELLWEYETSSRWGGGVALQQDGTAYAGGDTIYEYSPDGNEGWRFPLGTCDSVPALRPDGSLVCGSWEGKLYAVNPDGSQAWEYDCGFYQSIYNSPAVDSDGSVVFGSYTEVIALNADGTEKWVYPDPVSIWAGPTIDSAGHVYFVSYDGGVIYCVNMADGSLVWQHAVGDYVTTEPAIGLDGTVYVANRAGKLFAIGAAP